MTPEQFTYWLQGYAELNEAPPTAEQWQSIREHLATVFNKVTPPLRLDDPRDPLLWAPAPDLTSRWGPPLRSECVSAPVKDTIFIC